MSSKPPTIDPDTIYTQEELCHFLGKSKYWAERARWAGTGPKFVKVGRTPKYTGKNILAWLESCTRTSTSSKSGGQV